MDSRGLSNIASWIVTAFANLTAGREGIHSKLDSVCSLSQGSLLEKLHLESDPFRTESLSDSDATTKGRRAPEHRVVDPSSVTRHTSLPTFTRAPKLRHLTVVERVEELSER